MHDENKDVYIDGGGGGGDSDNVILLLLPAYQLCYMEQVLLSVAFMSICVCLVVCSKKLKIYSSKIDVTWWEYVMANPRRD